MEISFEKVTNADAAHRAACKLQDDLVCPCYNDLSQCPNAIQIHKLKIDGKCGLVYGLFWIDALTLSKSITISPHVPLQDVGCISVILCSCDCL